MRYYQPEPVHSTSLSPTLLSAADYCIHSVMSKGQMRGLDRVLPAIDIIAKLFLIEERHVIVRNN